MFDAKSILESIIAGAAARPSQTSGGSSAASGGLGDIMGQLARAAQGGAGGAATSGGLGGLGDILGKMMPQAGASPGVSHADGAAAPGGGQGGLADILGRLQAQAAGAGLGGAGGGGLMDILTKVLGQATDGAREGAGRIGAATGANDALTKAFGGMSPNDIMDKLKDVIAQNQLGAGAAAGGLGAVVLGTHAGRTVAMSAAKIGALALIGGLAYKAYQNYANGQPIINSAHMLEEAAPAGSGFEAAAVTNASAQLYIKAMIAAAAADGRVDDREYATILGDLKGSGAQGDAAKAFMAEQMKSPATVDELSQACETDEQRVQVYTAARLAVTPDGGAEDAFLADLAEKLGIDAKLAAHIDAAASHTA